MVKKILAVLLIIGLFITLTACAKEEKPPQNEKPPQEETPAEENPGGEPAAKPKVEVPPNMEEVEKNQEQVDKGQTPWMLDPLQVTQTFVSLLISPGGGNGEFPINIKDLTVLEKKDAEASVEVKSGITWITKVYLKRLVKKDDTGIWTVVGYDLDESRHPSIGGIHLDDPKDKVEEILGKDYEETSFEEPGHFPEAFNVWEFKDGYTVTIGKDSEKVLQITATSKEAKTNMDVKVGDTGEKILKTYRDKYIEPESIHGGKLYGAFKVEHGQVMIFDFNEDDGFFNANEVKPDDELDRITLSTPAYLDDSF